MAICRPVSTGTNQLKCWRGPHVGWIPIPSFSSSVPSPAAVIASPTFHLFLFFSVVVKFSKEVWEAL